MTSAPLPLIPVDAARSVDTVCGYCGVGCGLTLTVDDGTVTTARGTATHPANRGRLCTKGATTADLLNAPGRLTTALIRDRRDAEARPADVDDAVADTARRLSEIRDRHGPDSIAVYVSGQMSLEAQYLANKLVKGFLGTNQIESNSRLCMAGASTGYKQSLGADGPPGSYDDIDHADAFLVIGANMADCHPILFLRMMDRVAAGARLIVVDPRRTATARRAHLHLAVRPGTDVALLNGLLRLIVVADGIDREFIAAHTTGWDRLAELLEDYPVDRVAAVTGIAEHDLRAAADMLVAADAWMTLWTMGLNQSTHGTANTTAVCNLHLATGTVCRLGCGPFSLTGQPNAMGGREMGYLGPGLPGQRTALDPAHRGHVERLWNVPVGTIRDDPGGGTVDLFERMAEGQIRAAWIICTNPVASVANRSTVIAALRRAEFVVVQEAFEGAETTAYADIVLPAALWTEAEGTMVNSERSVSLTRPAVAAPAQARPDWVLISQIARAMGFTEGFAHADAAAVFDEITRFHNPITGWDLRGIDYRRLAEGPVQWPAVPNGPARNPIRYIGDDGGLRFPTPDGRARFLAREYLPPAETPDDEYPMTLTTGRVAHQWHTMTKTGRVAKLCRLDPESFVQLHSVDAQRLRIDDGTLVEVRSRRGVARVKARVDDGVAVGVCFVPMHWGDAAGELLAINAVTNDAVDPESLQPEFKACAVALSPVAAPDPPEVPVTQTILPADGIPAGSLSADGLPADSLPAGSPSAVRPDPLAIALGVAELRPELSEIERHYLGGLLRGLSANPPDGAVPVTPENAPLDARTRTWVDGVLAGYYSRVPATTIDGLRAPRTIRVVWASQTGTAQEYASVCAQALDAAGFAAVTIGADGVGADDLVDDVLFLAATTGSGDAPDTAIPLWDLLSGLSVQDLPDVRYAVLGFGDSSYADFCGFARKLDARLETLGAARLCAAAFCEPDYASTADAWLTTVMQALDAEPPAAIPPSESAPSESTPSGSGPSEFSRHHPFPTCVIENVSLTDPAAGRDVRRIAFDLPEGTLTYTAGDALGVWPRNSTALVDEWLRCTRLDGEERVSVDDAVMPLRKALTEHYEIARCTRDVIALVAARYDDPDLTALLTDPRALADWAWGRQTVDLLTEHPIDATVDEWLSVLRPLQPRLYSISSSPAAHANRVEITVSIVRYGSPDAQRQGVCSGFLADLAPAIDRAPDRAPDDAERTVRVFIQPNSAFGPPADDAAPAIMIGPGTGVAPFRGFLHQRAAAGATGDNWLFFGDRHRATDFLYADELDAFTESGVLTRLDLAFSRDQREKIYVQHRMAEHAADLWAWIRRGAHVYVCGDAARMARDVDDALIGVIAEHGRMAPAAAERYLRSLAAERRYVRDVY